jgi:hypothetical protein
VPVYEPASGRAPSIHLPVANEGQPLVEHQNLINLLHFEHRVLTEVQAVSYNCFPDSVIATFLAFKNSGYQSEHILVDDIFLFHCVNVLYAQLDNLGDLLTSIPINQNDPFVD